MAAVAMQATVKWLNPLTPISEVVIGGVVSFLSFGGVLYLMYYLSNRFANKI